MEKALAGMLYLVAAIFVEQHQEHSHDNDDTDHDNGVQHRVQETLAHRWGVLTERGVDPAG